MTSEKRGAVECEILTFIHDRLNVVANATSDFF
jgi:hypothetical protein